ncbi:hypothetical protein [Streptomyces sp. SPB162]|uniref:hypothetical protein n=1 Tax=Streptomyces sp. SPB162 TaxID=2940560 RepID=UPI002406B181|nr:hypothetical protein [Streptomyces sp. SPB162]MDF9816726.1 hypothetical protein [Streptomyces sp. SPB162]
MPDHENSERLASYADILAGELPGAWTSTYLPSENKDDLIDLTDRVWDLDLVADTLAETALQHAAVLSRPDGAQFLVLDRHDDRDGFLIAALAPQNLPDEAYRAVPEPNGIALVDDPFQGAETVAGDLLARYDSALAQVRHNAIGGVQPSQPERVVLTWQPDGSLAAAPVGEVAGAVLSEQGFVQDPQSGIFRLGGDDTTVQAHAVLAIGRQLDALGISTALQHTATRTAPTVTLPPAPAATRALARRTR